MKRDLFKLLALVTIICIVGCSDDVGISAKGKLYFSNSKSWKDSGTLIYENFDPFYIVPYSYHVDADSISLYPIHSSNTNDLRTYLFEKDLNKLVLLLEDTDKHAVYKPQ